MKAFVTGSNSHFAAALLPRLCARAGVERVTGIDLAPPRYAHANFDARQLASRSPQLEGVPGWRSTDDAACVFAQV